MNKIRMIEIVKRSKSLDLYTVSFTLVQPQGMLEQRLRFQEKDLTFSRAKAFVKSKYFRQGWSMGNLTVRRQSDTKWKYFKSPNEFFTLPKEEDLVLQ